jgi:hypothetical protein
VSFRDGWLPALFKNKGGNAVLIGIPLGLSNFHNAQNSRSLIPAIEQEP